MHRRSLENFDHEQGEKLVEATCNAHALLKFRDIKDKYPAEYAEAGKVYSAVFDNDDTAKALEHYREALPRLFNEPTVTAAPAPGK